MRKLLFESLFRRPFTEQAPSTDDAAVTELATAVGIAARRRLGRSLSIREIDAGSCNGCEVEIVNLNSPIYDLERLGIHFASHFEREIESLAAFEADGLVRRSETGLEVTDTGRLFIRNIAMCFDNTLASSSERKHSRTI